MGLIKFFANRLLELVTVLVLILLLPYIPPNINFSKSYVVKPSLPLEGKLAINERLNDTVKWHEGEILGPEAFAEYNGELYTGVHGGDVIKIVGNHITPIAKFGKPCKGLYQEKICGRPLGMVFDKSGLLYVADAYYGIFKVDVKTGKKTLLVSMQTEINGKQPKIPNGIAVSSTGDVYWSDSSTDFYLEDGMFDMFADGSGRLVKYDPKSQKNTVLIDDIHFANGVHLSENEEYVLVAETANSRILRYHLKGPKKGTYDVFIDQLPGLPDNINSDGQGGYFFPLIISRSSDFPFITQIFSPFPRIRKLISRLFALPELGLKLINDFYPNRYAEIAIHLIGHFGASEFINGFVTPERTTILRVSKNGEILECLHTTNLKKVSRISEAFIYKDSLLLGSPFNDYIGRISLKNAGLHHLKDSTQKTPTTTTKTSTTTKPPSTTTKATTTTTTTKPPTTTTTTTRPLTTTTTTKPPTTTTTTTKPPTTTTKPPTTTTTTSKPTTTTTKPPPSTTAKPSTTTSKPPTTTTKPPTTTTTKSPPTTKPSSASTTKQPPSTTSTSKPPTTKTPPTSTGSQKLGEAKTEL